MEKNVFLLYPLYKFLLVKKFRYTLHGGKGNLSKQNPYTVITKHCASIKEKKKHEIFLKIIREIGTYMWDKYSWFMWSKWNTRMISSANNTES